MYVFVKKAFVFKECAVERYGVECKGICSGHCASSTSCNHVTGLCDRGCAVGWEGSLCDKGIINRNGSFLLYKHVYN